MTRSLADRIRLGLRAVADPADAPAMDRYMKVHENGQLCFLGVRRPGVRRTVRESLERGEDLVEPAIDLWDNATHREERYAAQELLARRPARDRLDLLDLHERMAVSGAWWDHVDEVAHRVGTLIAIYPAELSERMVTWSRADDMWLRRLAIIGQLGRRASTDRDLLTAVIEPNLDDREFFIRKAIGWALRELAWTDPDWVRAFADAHPLSPLSRREALKHLV